MDENRINGLQNELDNSMMFLKAIEDVKRENEAREERNRAKAKAAAEKRRRKKALEDTYAEYCRCNPPTREEYENAVKVIRSCLKGKEEQNDKK